ncbi:FAD-dependent oxidoreductase [Nonomuraea sp. NPDC050556]|uniref:FAD-dependent oxidoreductase n=1 Tax=Nonomuraea sp. NPDC050556 TaxID=3364369 RepID=UPI0037A945DB
MTDFDVIVVGGRVAGAATALLLARRGLRVLLAERAALDADTISSHQLQIPGVALLQRWGLLDRLYGTPPASTLTFDAAGVVLNGVLPQYDGIGAIYSPRRTLLDPMLAGAASEAGAEVREHFRVQELLWSDGRVAGVAGRDLNGRTTRVTAPFVVGADGKHSFVAQAAGAPVYRERPALSFAAYSYYANLPVSGGELYQRTGAAAAVFPTNGGLTMVYTSRPVRALDAAYRRDLEEGFLRTLDGFGELGERVRAADRAERVRTTPDQPNRFHQPYGPGWALVGDAGVVMDSVTAQGMTNALRDAALLSEAIGRMMNGERRTMAGYHRARDAAVTPMYDLTVALARHDPGMGERLTSVPPDQVSNLLGALTGVVPPAEFFGPGRMARLVGGFAAASLAKVLG